MPTVRYNFLPIASIAQKPEHSNVDVIGVVHDISQVTRLTSKAGRELTKRTMTLSDDSGAAIELTLWGKDAEAFPESGSPVVAFKGMRVTAWNEKSLSFGMGSLLEVEPANQEATERLRSWWGDGSNVSVQSLSVQGGGRMGGSGPRDETSREPLAELKERELTSEKPHYANVRAGIAKINPTRNDAPIYYPSCPKCTKKVIEGAEYHCESCGWQGSACNYRYVLSMIIEDASGSSWVSAFNDQAAQILGKPANELKALKDESLQQYEQVIANAERQRYVMRVRAKLDSWQGVERVKIQALKLDRINFVDEMKLLLSDISKYDISDVPKSEFPKMEDKTELEAEVEFESEPKGDEESFAAKDEPVDVPMAQVKSEVKSEVFSQFDDE